MMKIYHKNKVHSQTYSRHCKDVVPMNEASDSDNWYYADGEQPIGPFKIERLREILTSIPNRNGTLIWREGLKGWKTADSFSELLLAPPPIPKREEMPVSLSGGEDLSITPPNETGSTKKIIAGIITVLVVIVAAAFGRVIGREGYRAVSHAVQPSSLELLTKGQADGARQLKQKVPQKLDDITTLIDADSDGPMAIYYYKLDVSAFEVTSNDFQNLKKTILEKTCKTDMRRMTELGAVYRYSYKDRDGKLIGTFDFVKGDCAS